MKFTDLVDIDELRALCECFTDTTGAVTAILDLDGNILIATGWQDICTRFHRVHPTTACRCRESDTVLAGQLKRGEAYNVYRCENGLVDVAVPITIAGRHLANFFTGQFFFEPPDEEFFIHQAQEFGFDTEAYLDALHRVPVFSEHQVRKMMDFFSRLARLIGEMGMATKALRKSEERYRSIVDMATEGIWVLGPDSRTSFVNVRMANILGRSREEMIGRPVTDFMLEEDVPHHLQRMEDRGRGIAENYEERFLRPNGDVIWAYLSAAPIYNDEHDFYGSFAMLTDITERKHTDEALRKRNEELERFERLVVGRELKMLELKNRIAELELLLATAKRDSGTSGAALESHVNSAPQGDIL